MTDRIATGDYKISYYDGYGARLKSVKDKAGSLESARDIGDAHIRDNHKPGDLSSVASYTIDRRIYNSLDKKGA